MTAAIRQGPTLRSSITRRCAALAPVRRSSSIAWDLPSCHQMDVPSNVPSRPDSPTVPRAGLPAPSRACGRGKQQPVMGDDKGDAVPGGGKSH